MKYIYLGLACFFLIFIGLKHVWPQSDQGSSRFEVVYQQVESLSSLRVIKDKETGVKYLYYKYGNGASLTKLEGEK